MEAPKVDSAPVNDSILNNGLLASNTESLDETIAKYCTEVQTAFLTGFEDSGKIEISEKDPSGDIAELANEALLNFVEIDRPETARILETRNEMLVEMEISINLKAFLAASRMALFRCYFPELEDHFPQFRRRNQSIARALLNAFPCLLTSKMLNLRTKNELGHVMSALIKISKNIVQSGLNERQYLETLPGSERLYKSLNNLTTPGPVPGNIGVFDQTNSPNFSSKLNPFGGTRNNSFGSAGSSSKTCSLYETSTIQNNGTSKKLFTPVQESVFSSAEVGTNYLHSILAMPEHMKFSLEELRLKDYEQNQRFGTQQQGHNILGNKGLFGKKSDKAGIFFGQPTQKSSEIFGKESDKLGGLFGQNTAPPSDQSRHNPSTSLGPFNQPGKTLTNSKTENFVNEQTPCSKVEKKICEPEGTTKTSSITDAKSHTISSPDKQEIEAKINTSSLPEKPTIEAKVDSISPPEQQKTGAKVDTTSPPKESETEGNKKTEESSKNPEANRMSTLLEKLTDWITKIEEDSHQCHKKSESILPKSDDANKWDVSKLTKKYKSTISELNKAREEFIRECESHIMKKLKKNFELVTSLKEITNLVLTEKDQKTTMLDLEWKKRANDLDTEWQQNSEALDAEYEQKSKSLDALWEQKSSEPDAGWKQKSNELSEDWDKKSRALEVEWKQKTRDLDAECKKKYKEVVMESKQTINPLLEQLLQNTNEISVQCKEHINRLEKKVLNSFSSNCKSLTNEITLVNHGAC